MDKENTEIDIKQVVEKLSSLTDEDRNKYISYLEQVLKGRNFKPFDELTFTDGYIFGKVMLNKEICTCFLESVLNIKIDNIEYIELEKVINETFASKSVRLDVYAKDDKGTVYNIEMQVSPKCKLSLGKRMRYYQVMIDTVMLKKGKENDYSKLKKSIIIFICPFKLFGGKRQIYTFNNYCKENKRIKLKDETTKIFITTKGKKSEKLNFDLEALIDYINGGDPDNLFVKKIEKEIKDIKSQEKERVNYMLSSLTYTDSIREGKDIGRKEGKRIGEAQKTVNAIKLFMNNAHLPIEQVMNFLEIPLEQQGLYYQLVNDPVFYEKYFADESNFYDPSDYIDEDFEENEEDYYDDEE